MVHHRAAYWPFPLGECCFAGDIDGAHHVASRFEHLRVVGHVTSTSPQLQRAQKLTRL